MALAPVATVSHNVDIHMKNACGSHHLPAFIAKMKSAGLPPPVIDTFVHYYGRVIEGETGLVSDRDIRPVSPDEVVQFESISDCDTIGSEALPQTVSIVLNGGLGTSMGLTGPKSLIKIKDGESFLSIILKQAETNAVTLAFMNSFNTHEETLAAISVLKPSEFPDIFQQHKFPKILREDLSPAVWPQNPELEWNPPGHGDVYTALWTSGKLQELLDKEIHYAFISNSDNLGAHLDASLLGYFVRHKFAFMMEVAKKTPADIKGGHVAWHRNGRLILRETAQCPQEELGAFKDIRRYRYFNTNNIWINLKALKNLFDTRKIINLPVILNPKTLDPRDETSPQVYQIESAMGAAISLFDNAAAVQVPRSRFYPVKTCNDLLVVRSDCFVFTPDHILMINPARKGTRNDIANVKLDPIYYGQINDLDKRFAEGVPSLVACDSLTIEGDIRFEKDVKITGDVRIKNTGKSQAVVKTGTVIEEDLVLRG